MPTVSITPHPTRKSSRVPKSRQRLGDTPDKSPQKEVPTHELIRQSINDDMDAESHDVPKHQDSERTGLGLGPNINPKRTLKHGGEEEDPPS